MIHNHTQHAFPFTRSALLLVAVSVVSVAIVGKICQVTGHAEWIAPATWSAAACLVAAIVALIPVAWRTAQDPAAAAEGFIIGVVLRLVLTFGLVAALASVSGIEPRALAVWAAVWYLVVLAVETALVAGYMNRHCSSGPMEVSR